MSQSQLALKVANRAHDAKAWLSGAISKAVRQAAIVEKSRLGAYATMSAVALGGMMMMANLAHDRRAETAAAVAATPAVAVAAPKPAPIEAEPLPTPIPTVTPTPVAEKTTVRIDTTPTGAIAEKPAVKPKHKHHLKKNVELDNGR